MRAVDTVVIGAGHAGLAVSHLLGRAGRDHVVIDRGRDAESWRTQRWDSLRLLPPRWMTRLPGWRYTGPGQEGFMPVAELVTHLERYAAEVSTWTSGERPCTAAGTCARPVGPVATTTWRARQDTSPVSTRYPSPSGDTRRTSRPSSSGAADEAAYRSRCVTSSATGMKPSWPGPV